MTLLQPPIWFISADFRTTAASFSHTSLFKTKVSKIYRGFQFFTTLHWTVLSFWRVRDARIKSHVKMSWFYSSSGNFGAPDGPSENPSCSQAEWKAHNDWSSWITSQSPVHRGAGAFWEEERVNAVPARVHVNLLAVSGASNRGEGGKLISIQNKSNRTTQVCSVIRASGSQTMAWN